MDFHLPDEADQPTLRLFACAHCGQMQNDRVCVECHNNFILGLRLAVKTSALTDWEPTEPQQAWLNHRQMMRNYAMAQQWVDWGAYVRWPIWLDLIMARAADKDPQFWEVEHE